MLWWIWTFHWLMVRNFSRSPLLQSIPPERNTPPPPPPSSPFPTTPPPDPNLSVTPHSSPPDCLRCQYLYFCTSETSNLSTISLSISSELRMWQSPPPFPPNSALSPPPWGACTGSTPSGGGELMHQIPWNQNHSFDCLFSCWWSHLRYTRYYQ
jgi:hypothetical protein